MNQQNKQVQEHKVASTRIHKKYNVIKRNNVKRSKIYVHIVILKQISIVSSGTRKRESNQGETRHFNNFQTINA